MTRKTTFDARTAETVLREHLTREVDLLMLLAGCVPEADEARWAAQLNEATDTLAMLQTTKETNR